MIIVPTALAAAPILATPLRSVPNYCYFVFQTQQVHSRRK